jgi:D-glucosaminate-6-phosphate ammonia-lyase
MMGMLAAVEAWGTRNHQQEWKTWLSWLDSIAKRMAVIPGITTSVFEPTELSNRSPVLTISWDPTHLNINGDEVAEEVGRNKPRIALGSESGKGLSSITITTGQMQPGNEKMVAERLFDLLPKKRGPAPAALKAPAAAIGGRWDTRVEFFSSVSKHTLFIEQDGNWLKGTHKGDFSIRELTGTIEGNEVKLKSVDQHPADSITFLFSTWANTGQPHSVQRKTISPTCTSGLQFLVDRHWQHKSAFCLSACLFPRFVK